MDFFRFVVVVVVVVLVAVVVGLTSFSCNLILLFFRHDDIQ